MRRVAAIIRDKIARMLTSEHEINREALRLITKQKEVDLSVRLKAQFLLHSYPKYTRPVTLRNRCIENGHARSVLLPFKMNRIAFRELALLGQIPGVKKSRW
jgi:small subunit ribosomal protein S14